MNIMVEKEAEEDLGLLTCTRDTVTSLLSNPVSPSWEECVVLYPADSRMDITQA